MSLTLSTGGLNSLRSALFTWIPWLAGVLCLALFVSLGNWQLQRADDKRAVMADFERAADAPHGSLDLSVRPLEALRFMPVQFQGRHLVDRQFLLDNQVVNGQVGYRVLTPVEHQASGRTVLLERGWISRGETRAGLPDVETGLPAGQVTIRGHVYVPYGEGYRLGVIDEGRTEWPRVIQYLDFEAIGERLGRHVEPLTVRLDEDAPHGFARDWRPVLPMGPERHLAYAVQWFGLALALIVIALIVVYRRRTHGNDG